MFMFEYLRLLTVLFRYRDKEQFLEYLNRAFFDTRKKEMIRIVYGLMEKQFADIRRDSGGP